MMQANEITVEVKAKLDVSKSTAEACLALVEIYLNDHSNIDIVSKRNADGTESLSFSERLRCSDASNTGKG